MVVNSADCPRQPKRSAPCCLIGGWLRLPLAFLSTLILHAQAWKACSYRPEPAYVAGLFALGRCAKLPRHPGSMPQLQSVHFSSRPPPTSPPYFAPQLHAMMPPASRQFGLELFVNRQRKQELSQAERIHILPAMRREETYRSIATRFNTTSWQATENSISNPHPLNYLLQTS